MDVSGCALSFMFLKILPSMKKCLSYIFHTWKVYDKHFFYSKSNFRFWWATCSKLSKSRYLNLMTNNILKVSENLDFYGKTLSYNFLILKLYAAHFFIARLFYLVQITAETRSNLFSFVFWNCIKIVWLAFFQTFDAWNCMISIFGVWNCKISVFELLMSTRAVGPLFGGFQENLRAVFSD